MPYEKHTWLRGETITAENLNHLEDGIVGEQTTRASQDQFINDRIDQIIAPTGEAPNPTEITDARIGVDDTVYNTLGTAIRTQVGDLKNAIDDYVMDHYTYTEPTNWLNISNMELGNLLANGTVTESESRCYTDYFIPVEYGKTLYYRRMDTDEGIYMRHITCYDSGKNLLSAKGVDANRKSFAIPEDVAFVKVTTDYPFNTANKPMLYVGTSAPSEYSEYFDPTYIITTDFLTSSSQQYVDKLKNKELVTTDFANKYSCAMPRKKLKMTVGIAETFYYFSAFAPFKTTYGTASAGLEYSTRGNDCITFPNETALTAPTGYTWGFYDCMFNLIENFGSYPRSIIAENIQSCSLLAIGDSTVDQDYMTAKLLEHFTEQGKTLTLLGTLGSGDNKNEGRAGWQASDYFTNKQYNGVVNPFYNPTSQTFDFSYYMANQGYNAPDFVVIQLGLNDLGNDATSESLWALIKAMIDSVLDYDSSIKVLLNLPTTPNQDQTKIAPFLPTWLNKVCGYNEYAQAQSLAEYSESQVRTSYCHLILDPATDIRDNVHPTEAGYGKMALEIVNQINHWQNSD